MKNLTMTIAETFKEKPHIYTVILTIENLLFVGFSMKFPEQMLKQYILIIQAVIVTCGCPIAVYGFWKWITNKTK